MKEMGEVVMEEIKEKLGEEQTEQTEEEQSEEEQSREGWSRESEGGMSDVEIMEKLKKTHAEIMDLIQELTEMYAFRREAMLAGDYEAEKVVIRRIKRRRKQFLELVRAEEELAERLESVREKGE